MAGVDDLLSISRIFRNLIAQHKKVAPNVMRLQQIKDLRVKTLGHRQR